MNVRVLATPRHACTGCGSCCQGAIVHVTADEARRVQEQAVELAIATPVVDGRLRQHAGRCVFLDDAQRCRLHARWGADDKPLVCRQFPFVIVQTEDGVRAGLDPATTAFRTTRLTGPDLVPPPGAAARRAELPPHQAAVERGIIAACSAPDARLLALIRGLCGASDGLAALPDGFAGRWVQTLQQADLAELMSRDDVGPVHRRLLAPLLDAIPSWDPAAPPADPVLDPDDERFTLDVVRAMLWLRLAHRLPLVQGVALLTAAGAVACAWADPRSQTFGPAVSTWARMLRAGPLQRALVPEPAALKHLVGA